MILFREVFFSDYGKTKYMFVIGLRFNNFYVYIVYENMLVQGLDIYVTNLILGGFFSAYGKKIM